MTSAAHELIPNVGHELIPSAAHKVIPLNNSRVIFDKFMATKPEPVKATVRLSVMSKETTPTIGSVASIRRNLEKQASLTNLNTTKTSAKMSSTATDYTGPLD